MVVDAQDELIWIDSNGVAHPLGDAATRRMKERKGAYRLMPAPGHVVFMRFTGEDGRRDREDGAIVRLAGEITGPGTMCDILALLSQAGWRGELMVFDGDSPRSIFFEAGNVLGARTSFPQERIGQILFHFGVITKPQLTAILALVTQGKRFGASAVRLGVLTEDQVYKYLRKQVEEIVFATLRIADGFYCFLEDFDETRLVSRQVLSGAMLLMDCVTRMDEMRFFRPRIPSSEYVPQRNPGAQSPDDEFSLVWRMIDGERDINDIGRDTQLGEFEVTKQVFKLLQSRHVMINPPRLRGGAAEVIELANRALREVHTAIDAAGLGTSFRKSTAGFAEGSYDDLFKDAGPLDDGTLKGRRVLRNAIRLAGAADLQNYLREMLYDYVSFVLFSAGASMGAAREQNMSATIEPLLAQLRPPSSSTQMRVNQSDTIGESTLAVSHDDDDDEYEELEIF